MTAVWIVVILLVAAAVAVLLPRPSRTRSPSAGRQPPAPAREPLLQIALPETGNCCTAARRIETHRFQKEHAPPLPLADCSMKPGCHCRYRLVAERRTAERRAGREKRESVRFEEAPRREQAGRRARDNLWSNDGE